MQPLAMVFDCGRFSQLSPSSPRAIFDELTPRQVVCFDPRVHHFEWYRESSERNARMISQLCRRFGLILVVFAVLPAAPAFAIANVRDAQQGLPDVDARTGSVVPSAAQKQL